MLPKDYVAEHVDLGYAVTAHRAQGLTVDTAHVVVSATTTRENLYVSMTRGRHANTAYVALDHADDAHGVPPEDGEVNARTVLYGVLQHSGVELSAHQTIEAEQETWSSIAELAAEYETLAAAAQHDRWATLVRRSGLTPEQAESVINSDAFGPLTAVLRRAEATGHDVDRVLPRAVARRRLDDADDVAAVLQHRLRLATANRRASRVQLIAGLIPEALGPMPSDVRTALDQRADLIESRARALAEDATRSRTPWLRRLGEPPTDRRQRDRWLAEISTIAAYRDRYQITSNLPLGPRAETEAQRADTDRARAAQRRATNLTPERNATVMRDAAGHAPAVR